MRVSLIQNCKPAGQGARKEVLKSTRAPRHSVSTRTTEGTSGIVCHPLRWVKVASGRAIELFLELRMAASEVVELPIGIFPVPDLDTVTMSLSSSTL